MTRADAVVIALAGALTGGLFAKYWQAPRPAGEVEVRSGAQLVGRFPLGTARRIEVPGPRGTSVIEIRDGAARFVSSPCRNQVCVHAGWQRHAGGFAACVPNRVSITLAGSGEFDAVSQ